MKTKIECPPADELRHLLDGTLPDERAQECTQHMDSCEWCQAKLEDIATEGTNLSKVVARVNEAEPMATSAYWPALKSLEQGSNPSSQPNDSPRSGTRTRDLALDFLEPATDSVYLGRLAQFDVMRIIGRGGMGVVLEAFDSRLQRHVALKVLDPDLVNDEVSRQRFCREARSAASITHENVVAVHQVEKSVTNKLPYLVMQLISGESLEQRIAREKRLPMREIVRIGMQAAHGLAAAHAQGLIHRDIKPGNILLESPHDRVKLTDFGLARAAEDVRLTSTGFVSGTPLYMAPEQALGGEADPRSDLFSLGAILYEMCTGQPPFMGNSALLILKQITEAKHRPLRELNPATPEWLAETIDRLLAKKPSDRIQTAAHLAELLEFQWALMKTTSEDVPTVCQIEERKRTIRNRVIAVGIGAAFLALGLLGGKYLGNNNGLKSNAVASTSAAVSSAEPIAVLSAKAGAVWSVSFDKKSEKVAMAVEDGSVRIWDLPTKSIETTFSAHRGNIWSTRFSQSCEALATAGDDGLIKIWRPGETEPFKTFQLSTAVRGMTFTHDDHSIVAGDRDGGLRIWTIDSDKPLVEAQQPGTIYTIAIAANDEVLATAGSDKIVRLWNAKTLQPKLVLEGHAGPIFGLSFNRDGHRLASVGWDKTIRVWDLSTGLLQKSWEGHDFDIWGVAYSPDGTKIATGSTDGSVKLWNADTGALLSTFLGHKTAIHTVSFNRDGTLLASGGRDGAARIWKID